jgi:hypothetical protein
LVLVIARIDDEVRHAWPAESTVRDRPPPRARVPHLVGVQPRGGCGTAPVAVCCSRRERDCDRPGKAGLAAAARASDDDDNGLSGHSNAFSLRAPFSALRKSNECHTEDN